MSFHLIAAVIAAIHMIITTQIYIHVGTKVCNRYCITTHMFVLDKNHGYEKKKTEKEKRKIRMGKSAERFT